jgi:hypothetical protein
MRGDVVVEMRDTLAEPLLSLPRVLKVRADLAPPLAKAKALVLQQRNLISGLQQRCRGYQCCTAAATAATTTAAADSTADHADHTASAATSHRRRRHGCEVCARGV